MWGTDEKLPAGKDPVEGWVNPLVKAFFAQLPRRTLGFRGRANGPVDNPRSSCLPCHGRAMDMGFTGREVPFVPSSNADEEQIHQFFRNLKPTEPFYSGFRSLDYSLQLAVGIASFRDWVEDKHPTERGALIRIQRRPRRHLFPALFRDRSRQRATPKIHCNRFREVSRKICSTQVRRRRRGQMPLRGVLPLVLALSLATTVGTRDASSQSDPTSIHG